MAKRSKASKNEAIYWTGELERTARNMIGNPAGCLIEDELKLVKEIYKKIALLRLMIDKS
jgi:hypothetical protein